MSHVSNPLKIILSQSFLNIVESLILNASLVKSISNHSAILNVFTLSLHVGILSTVVTRNGVTTVVIGSRTKQTHQEPLSTTNPVPTVSPASAWSSLLDLKSHLFGHIELKIFAFKYILTRNCVTIASEHVLIYNMSDDMTHDPCG